MEAVGVAASIVQLAGAGLQLSIVLYEYVDSVSGADKRIKDIARDVELTSAVIQELGNTFSQNGTAQVMTASSILTAESAVKECRYVFDELEAIVAKSRESRIAKFTLPFKDTKIQLLRANLDRWKSTLQLLMQALLHAQIVRNNDQDRAEILRQRKELKRLIEAKKASFERYEDTMKSVSSSEDSTLVDDSEPSTPKATKPDNRSLLGGLGMGIMALAAIAPDLSHQDRRGRRDPESIQSLNRGLDPDASDSNAEVFRPVNMYKKPEAPSVAEPKFSKTGHDKQGLITNESLALCIQHIQALLRNIEVVEGQLDQYAGQPAQAIDAEVHLRTVYAKTRDVLDTIIGHTDGSAPTLIPSVYTKAQRARPRAVRHATGSCRGCRSGNVKCDEALPACCRCTAMGVTCTYDRIPPGNSVRPNLTVNSVIQKMPSLAASQEYKPGCKSCRAGRRKCDEDTPRCGRCSRRGLHCEYIERSTSSWSARPSRSHEREALRTPEQEIRHKEDQDIHRKEARDPPEAKRMPVERPLHSEYPRHLEHPPRLRRRSSSEANLVRQDLQVIEREREAVPQQGYRMRYGMPPPNAHMYGSSLQYGMPPHGLPTLGGHPQLTAMPGQVTTSIPATSSFTRPVTPAVGPLVSDFERSDISLQNHQKQDQDAVVNDSGVDAGTDQLKSIGGSRGLRHKTNIIFEHGERLDDVKSNVSYGPAFYNLQASAPLYSSYEFPQRQKLEEDSSPVFTGRFQSAVGGFAGLSSQGESTYTLPVEQRPGRVARGSYVGQDPYVAQQSGKDDEALRFQRINFPPSLSPAGERTELEPNEVKKRSAKFPENNARPSPANKSTFLTYSDGSDIETAEDLAALQMAEEQEREDEARIESGVRASFGGYGSFRIVPSSQIYIEDAFVPEDARYRPGGSSSKNRPPASTRTGFLQNFKLASKSRPPVTFIDDEEALRKIKTVSAQEERSNNDVLSASSLETRPSDSHNIEDPVGNEKVNKLNNLKVFSKSFKLDTPVPQDLVPILAREGTSADTTMRRGVDEISIPQLPAFMPSSRFKPMTFSVASRAPASSIPHSSYSVNRDRVYNSLPSPNVDWSSPEMLPELPVSRERTSTAAASELRDSERRVKGRKGKKSKKYQQLNDFETHGPPLSSSGIDRESTVAKMPFPKWSPTGDNLNFGHPSISREEMMYNARGPTLDVDSDSSDDEELDELLREWTNVGEDELVNAYRQ